ncbi:MAG TPA: FkbM family methyltransferase [Parafilimonas sp.]|nr:FkbM family methyltransferase [Parafilimonas sp.]
MGFYEKIGLRNVGIEAINIINLIRLYGLNDGVKLFYSTVKRKNSLYEAKASFLKQPFILRDNKSDKPIFFQVFYEKQYDLYGIDFPDAKRIIDGGANIGCASVYFSIRFPEAEILAIEPERNNYALLEKNIQPYKNIQSLEAGIWNKNEPLSIANPEGGAAEFMFENSTANNNCIKGMTIQSLLELKNWDSVDIIKLDIEGAEKEVFSTNDLSWLRKTRLLIIELHDRYKEGCTKTVFKALDQFNYDAHFHHENIFIFFK